MSQTLSADLLDRALQLQLGLAGIWEEHAEPIGGWKVGFTSSDPRTPGDNRTRFEPDYRPFGFVLASRILPSGAAVARADLQVGNVEPELCLVLGEPLSGDIDAERARSAVRAVAAAFEINEIHRVNRVTPLPVRVAEGLNNWGMVVGATIDVPAWDLTSTTVEMRRDDEDPVVMAMPPGSIDDPFVSLARLARRLHRFGRGLEAGAHVLTGAFSHHRIGWAASSWRASFSGIGEVAVDFTD